MNFETIVTGKWILAGEHAVLRGSPALVFPLKSKFLKFEFNSSTQGFTVNFFGEHGEELQLLFWGVLEKACELKKVKRTALSGEIKITSNLPVGAGMGASAALCVAVTRWLHFIKVVSAEEIYEFSRSLENLFHGESSGVDIAVALSGEPIRFIRGGNSKPISLSWTPQWYISYSGKRGITAECVNKVKKLIDQNPTLGQEIDQRMREAVALCENSLTEIAGTQRLQLLTKAFQLAASCFKDWGLIEGAPEIHMKWLLDHGALAVKPTGSGDGGYILSLWDRQPPEEIRKKLIACF